MRLKILMSEYSVLDFLSRSSIFILSYPLLYLSDKLMPTIGHIPNSIPVSHPFSIVQPFNYRSLIFKLLLNK